MKDGSDFDEAEEGDNDRLFSLKELLSETEAKECECGEKMLSEKDRVSLLRAIHNELLTESERNALVKECINEVKSKDVELEIDLEEVIRLYVEGGLSLKKTGAHFGLKSGKLIKRILEDAGVEIRPVGFQKIEIDPDELYRLYFNERKDLKEIAPHFNCKSTTPLLRIFREQGWKTRYQETYEKEIDSEEVFRLYDEGVSIRRIGEHFGVSYGPILRIFVEHGKEYGQEIQIDPQIIHHLYFDEGLTRDKMCKRLGVSRTLIDRIFEEQEWEKRPAGFQSAEIDLEEFKKLYYGEELLLKEIAEHFEVSETTISRFRKEHNLRIRDKTTIRSLRDTLFGTECATCGKPRRIIHKKDGEPHLTEVLWRKKDLLALNPDDWVALCRPCHRITHSLMRYYQCEWKEIEIVLKRLAKRQVS